MSENATFKPRIIAFVCKWCTYAGADLAGMSRLQYSPNVKTLMLPCSGRIDITMVIRAFMQGADGVIVSGCHPGDCHYTAGNFRARRRWALLRDLLDTLGFDLNRFKLAWISAAEGNKWAKTVEEFASSIEKMGPYSAMHAVAQNHTPQAAPPKAALSATLDPSGTPADEALIKAVKAAFAAEEVSKVLGWHSRPTLGRSVPVWFDNAEAVEKMTNPGGVGNVTRLIDEPAVKGCAAFGVVARSSELAALNVLAQEAACDTEKVKVFTIDENGKFLKSGTLSELAPDVLAGLSKADVTGHSAETLQQLDQLMTKTPAERFQFWTEQASRCLRCYACRGVCPMCRCNRCYAEKNQPQWFPTASDGPGNLSWMIVRAFHLAGRCIGCGACQAACPADIQLNLLNAAAARSALRNFGFQAGTDPNAAPLQADYKQQDPETFIV